MNGIIKRIVRQPRLFYRILILCVVLVAVVSLLLSSLLYISFEKAIAAQNATFIQGNLEKTANSARFMAEWVRTIAIQTLYDNEVTRLLSYGGYNQQNVAIARRRLSSIRQASPYIVGIYLYNGNTGQIYSDIGSLFAYTRETFFDEAVFQYIDDTSARHHLVPIPRIMRYARNGTGDMTGDVFTFVLYENPNRRGEDDNVILVNISRQWLDHAIRSFDPDTPANLLIVDSEARLVYSGGATPIGTDLSGDPAILEALRQPGRAGYALTGAKKDREFVTWVRGEDKTADWTYLYRMPESVLTKDISRTRNTTVLFSVLMLFFGLCGSILYAFHVYRPISFMQNKLQVLEKVQENRDDIERQGFLRSVLRENGMQLQDIEKALERYRMPAVARQPVHLCLVSLDGYQRLERTLSIEQRERLHTGMLELLCRAASPHGETYAVATESGLFALLLSAVEPDEVRMSDLGSLIRQEVERTLEQSCSIVTGTDCSSWFHLPEAWKKLVSGLSERLFLGYGCLVDLSCMDGRKASGFDYPVTRERQMCQQLMLKHADPALVLCEGIITNTKGLGRNLLQVTLLRIVSAVMEMTDKLNHESGMDIHHDFESFMTRMNRAERLEDLMEGFRDMFCSIVEQISSGRTQSHKELVEAIKEAVHQRYQDSQLTIGSFGDITDLSASHLARIFARIEGESFSDHLRKYRLDMAQQRIAAHSESIQSIAEGVGFANPNHFYTIFKKEFGITPSEYRQRNQRA